MFPPNPQRAPLEENEASSSAAIRKGRGKESRNFEEEEMGLLHRIEDRRGGQEMSIEPPLQIEDKREGMEPFSGQVAFPLPPSEEEKENRPAPRRLGLLPGLQRLVEGSALPLGMGGGAPMLRLPQEFLSEEVSPAPTATLPLIAKGQWVDQGTLLPNALIPPFFPGFLSIPSRVKENREVQSLPKKKLISHPAGIIQGAGGSMSRWVWRRPKGTFYQRSKHPLEHKSPRSRRQD